MTGLRYKILATLHGCVAFVAISLGVAMTIDMFWCGPINIALGINSIMLAFLNIKLSHKTERNRNDPNA